MKALALTLLAPLAINAATVDYEINAELQCLALNVYHEARGEGLDGMIAVGQVTMNRVASNKYPDTICHVVYQYKQFSWTLDNKPQSGYSIYHHPREQYSIKRWENAVDVAHAVINQTMGVGISKDVLHYHADYVSPYWAKEMNMVANIGGHVFLN